MEGIITKGNSRCARNCLLILILLILLVPPPAVQAEKPFEWRHVGKDPYTGTIADAVNRNPNLSHGAKIKMIEKIMHSSVPAIRLRAVVEKFELIPADKREAVLASLTKNREFVHWQLILDAADGIFGTADDMHSKGQRARFVGTIRTRERIDEQTSYDHSDDTTYTLGEISVGEECQYMVFGAHRIEPSVIAHPEDNHAIRAAVYEVEDEGVNYVAKLPLACNNFCFSAFKLEVVGGPRKAEAKPSQAAPLTSLHLDRTIQINIWSLKDSADKELLRSLGTQAGSQSRDLGARLREAERAGRIARFSERPCPNYIIGIQGINFEASRGVVVRRNSIPAVIPSSFGHEQNAFDIPICDGQGSLSVPHEMLQPDMVVIARSPWVTPEIYYPHSGRLLTCTSKEMFEGRRGCPKRDRDTGEGEFYGVAATNEVINFHFVK